MTPKISVIMPVYNTEKYVGEAIESVLAQSFKDFELIIVDDGSSDKSFEICEGYSKKDERIRLYRNEENKGIAYTRNKLISLTNTNFIASQDSDDVSNRERLQLCFDFLNENEGYGVVSGNNEIIDEDGKNIGYREYSDDIKSVILKKSPISQGSSMFRKSIFLELGGYDPNINYGEDYDLWLKMYSKGYGIKNLQRFLYQLRIRNGQSKSSKLKKTIKNTIYIQKRAIKEYGIIPNFSDRVYHVLESILLCIPNNLILFLFKKLEYKKGKKS